MEKIITFANYLFDPLHFFWKHKITKQFLASVLVLVFIGSLVLIEFKKFGVLPGSYPWTKLPDNPFLAVHLAFSLLLFVEVISFIFVLPCSMSKAVGKQIEILSLIFLRSCFKRLTEFNEPVNFSNHLSTILEIGSYGVTALLIYVILFFYYRTLSKQADRDDSLPGNKLFYFVGGKKLISLVLFIIFIFLSGYNIYAYATSQRPVIFLNEFYTLLIYSDILILLIAHRYFPNFEDTFRNSGYALSTLLMRLCLTAPVYIDALIGLSAAIFALALTYVHIKTKSK